MAEFQITSEIGRLRRVLLHRPDLELRRLTPSNVHELLFDELLWVEQAQTEHDQFAALLRDHGVDVHLLGDLLAQVLADPGVRAGCWTRSSPPRRSARAWSTSCASGSTTCPPPSWSAG
jgi:arginine deiminase